MSIDFTNWIVQQHSTVQKAYDIAVEAHKNDKRWGGEPYITHVERVMMGTEAEYNSYQGNDKRSLTHVLSIAALHDVVENHLDKYSVGSVTAEMVSHDKYTNFQEKHFSNSLKAITKNQDYLSYIIEITYDVPAMIVKLADLKDNIKDIKKGSIKDKYELAQYLIERSLYL